MKLWELSCPRVQGSHTTVTGWKETSICEMPILSDFASKYNTLMKMMTSTPVTLRIYFRKINVSVKLKATHIPERHHIIASTCCLKGSRRWHALCQNGLYHHLNAALISVQESKTAEKITCLQSLVLFVGENPPTLPSDFHEHRLAEEKQRSSCMLYLCLKSVRL